MYYLVSRLFHILTKINYDNIQITQWNGNKFIWSNP